MRGIRALGFVVGISLVIVACGSSSGGSGAETSSSFAQSYCQLYAPCCAKLGKPADGQTCSAFIGAFTAGATYDPVAGQACLDAARAASSQPDFCSGSSSSLSSSTCKKVFKSASGAKAPGEACSQDGDCADSGEGTVSCATHFESGGGGQTRTCQVQIVGKEGDTPCLGTKNGNVTSYSTSGTAAPPSRGYICDVGDGVACDDATSKCKKIGIVGDDCSTSTLYACVKSAYCDSATKKCAARLPIGSDCSSGSSTCAAESYCNSATKRCVAQLDTGAPCTTSSECKSSSCVNKACGDSLAGSFSSALLCGK